MFPPLLERILACTQIRNKSLFRFSLDNDGNFHARPPIRPIRHTSSRPYSFSHASRSMVSAHCARAQPTQSRYPNSVYSGHPDSPQASILDMKKFVSLVPTQEHWYKKKSSFMIIHHHTCLEKKVNFIENHLIQSHIRQKFQYG